MYYNNIFIGAMGYINHINHKGDAQGNFTLLARKLLNKQDGQYGMFPVGTFLLNHNDTRISVITCNKFQYSKTVIILTTGKTYNLFGYSHYLNK